MAPRRAPAVAPVENAHHARPRSIQVTLQHSDDIVFARVPDDLIFDLSPLEKNEHGDAANIKPLRDRHVFIHVHLAHLHLALY